MIFKDFVLDIYNEGGITAAANKLYMSQPALSASLKRLEQELGVVLFDRATSPIQLTEEGKLYVETLNQVKLLTKKLEANFNDVKELKRGNITVGAAHFITSFFLLEKISRFSEIYPGILVNAVEASSSVLKEKLLSGELDIAIDYDFDEEHFVSYPILTENIFLAIPKKLEIDNRFSEYKLERKEIISKNDVKPIDSAQIIRMFQNEKFILMREGNNMEKHSSEILKDAKVKPDILLKTDQLITAYEAAIEGLGITFVTDSIINAIDDKDSLSYFRVSGINGSRILYFAKNKNSYISKATETFIEFAGNNFS